MVRKERFKHKLLWAFSVAFLLFLGLYFLLRDVFSWVSLVIPEFMGASVLGMILAISLKKKTNIKAFVVVLVLVLLVGVFGFAYGRVNDVRFLIDLFPNFMGGTGLGIVLSVIFRRKVFLG